MVESVLASIGSSFFSSLGTITELKIDSVSLFSDDKVEII